MTGGSSPDSPRLFAQWAESIPDPTWSVYDRVMQAVEQASIPFAVGGAFAFASYTQICRDTKDLDLYVLPQCRQPMIDAITAAGMQDYFDTRPYDRNWIYRSTDGSVIVDAIWAMANGRAQADEWWLSGPEIQIRNRRARVVPAEVLLWDKLYIVQRERCDWPDIMNLLFTNGTCLNWEEIFARLGADTDLLAGALAVFRWMSPGAARELPPSVWARVGISAPNRGAPEFLRDRVAWLDKREWYAPAARGC